MKSFIKGFLNEDLEGVPGAPRVYVAAFGKHPGWNDHMDDIGLVTESLVEAKRSLYVQGVSSQIESRAWDRLGAGGALTNFEHLFIWHRPVETIVGLIWSSRDGKGRQLYPMVLCVHVIAQPLDWIWSEVIPRMESAAESCRQATMPKQVIVALNTVQEALRRRSATQSSAENTAASRPSILGVKEWTTHFAQDPTSLRRVCHHLSGNINGLLSDREGESRSLGARLPSIPGATPSESLNTWLLFFNGQIDPFWPVLILQPRSGAWVDVVIGEPSKDDFFRLRAAPEAEPIISTIPYTVTEEFERRLAPVFSAVRSGRMPNDSFMSGKAADVTLGVAAQKLRSSRRPTAKDFLSRLLKRD
jgi:hypothetical protein